MDIDQDDLALLRHLRAAWVGGLARITSGEALSVFPGRAEGRVAHWAFGRTAELLDATARRRLMIGTSIVPSRDEILLLRIARALANNDWQTAEDAALWIVRRDCGAALAQSLAPAACALYGKAAPRRRKAASA